MRPKNAFTLVELLVVIGIIAILIAILLPALRLAQEQSKRVVCMNNHRQLLLATRMYADDWKDALPFTNSNQGETSQGWQAPGWLYWARMGKSTEQHVEFGLLWKFLRNRQIYRCPFDPPPYIQGTHRLSSYAMNRAMKQRDPIPQSYKLTDFKGNDVMFWESNELAETWNDGTNDATESITARHGSSKLRQTGTGLNVTKAAGAIIGCVGGHAEWTTVYEFNVEASRRPSRVNCGPKYR